MIYLDEILQGVKTVGITGHIRPDGDCVGSTLGVYNYIICRRWMLISVCSRLMINFYF